MISVGIISAPRNPVYLSTALDSFFRCFDLAPVVFGEPNTPNYLHKHRTIYIENSTCLGTVLNWVNSLETMIVNYPEAYIMMLEDDIQWKDSTTLRSFLMDQMTPSVGFVSPYCSLRNRPKIKGWGKPSGKNWFGALSVCMAIDKAESIIKNKETFIEHSLNKEGKPWHLDTALGRFFKGAIYTHNPTQVLHIGENSTFPRPAHKNQQVEDARRPAL